MGTGVEGERTFASPNHHSTATGGPSLASNTSRGKSPSSTPTWISKRSDGIASSSPRSLASGLEDISAGVVTTSSCVFVAPSDGARGIGLITDDCDGSREAEDDAVFAARDAIAATGERAGVVGATRGGATATAARASVRATRSARILV